MQQIRWIHLIMKGMSGSVPNYRLITEGFEEKNIPWLGNKFLTGNGYFGVRGTMEEYGKDEMFAINMAGIYDRVGDAWREPVNAPNPFYAILKVDGEELALPKTAPKAHRQELDFYHAIQMRETVWETAKGTVTVSCERFASMADQHILAMRYSVTADYDGTISVTTGVEGDVWDINGPHFAKMETSYIDGIKTVTGITGEKQVTVTVKSRLVAPVSGETVSSERAVMETLTADLKAGETFSLDAISEITTSQDVFPVKTKLKTVTYEALKAAHAKAWEDIWEISACTIEGDEDAEFALNYSLYHLNCIAPRNMDGVSIGARGLSGQVYKGAVFWDTEMFMLDYYIHTDPKVAKDLLKYRIDTISGARNKAKEYGLNGAYYAWESQEGGYEGCSDYNVVDVFTKRPMRTFFRDKQYHVSAAIVYGFMKYLKATGDYAIIDEGGLSVILESAQMYRSLLLKKADSDFYEIHDVVGPDEYHERVNNNAYTNRMAKFVFRMALEMISYAKEQGLNTEYDLDAMEVMLKDSAEHIYIPEPNEDGVIEQFDGYFNREDVSVDEVRSRLLDPKEYWGGAYGVAAETQVLKQADVVAMLSMFREDYSSEIMKANFSYYEPRTEHGSSLSACMYSLLSCYIGNPDAAYPLFMKSAQADLLPAGKEWIGLIYIGGTHPAAQGGAWIVAVKGFAGISMENGTLTATPNLPKGWKKLSFKLMYLGKLYQVTVTPEQAEIQEI